MKSKLTIALVLLMATTATAGDVDGFNIWQKVGTDSVMVLVEVEGGGTVWVSPLFLRDAVNEFYGADLADTSTVWERSTEGRNYKETGFKMPLRVGDVQIWFYHSGAQKQFLERQRSWTKEQWEMFDLIGWNEYKKLGDAGNKEDGS